MIKNVTKLEVVYPNVICGNYIHIYILRECVFHQEKNGCMKGWIGNEAH